MLPKWIKTPMGLALAFALFLGSFLGCGGGSTPTPTPAAPTIATQPAATQTVTAGNSVSFSVLATGTPAPTFQWKKGGTAVSIGGTAATYTIASPVVGDAGTYTVTVTNSAGNITSNPAVLNVLPRAAAPTIDLQPAPSTTVLEGGSATLTVNASTTDGGTLSYQWKNGTTNVGTNSNSISLNPALLSSAGTYTVVVTNSLNGTTATTTSSAAVVNVNPLPVVPVISAQPLTQSITEGNNLTLSVTATASNGTLSYQWRRGASNFGSNSSNLVFAPVALGDAGSYTVVVTNTLSGQTATATSNVAVLTVNPRAMAPTISVQPAPTTTVLVGGSATLTVNASTTDGGVLSYQWKKGSTAVGTNSASLTFNPAALADAGSYTVVITNTLNGTTAQTTSDTATLTVNSTPTGPDITVQPQSQTVTAPDGATFGVTATGTDLTYAWKKNGTAISGATQSTYTVLSTDLHAISDQYSVVVTETGVGSTESQAATLTVLAPKPVFAGDPTVVDTSRNYVAVSSWFTTAPVDPSGSFRVGYDRALLNPVWSSTCFFPSAPWVFARPSSYPTDTRISGSLDSSDYSNTGYSRGHMTQFADLRDCYGADAGASSMYMSNMCPQVQALNGAAWGNLETLTAQTLPASFGRVWVYTGPIFSTQLVAPIGAKKIPIATAFYKVLVRETTPGNPKVLALIVPHSTTISSGNTAAVPLATTDFWKFATTVDRVQALTGLNFFPTPTSPLPAGFTTTVEVAGWGTSFEQGPNRPNVHMITPSWDSTFTHVHNSTGAVTTINTTTANVGDVVPFVAQVTADPDAIASTTWNFGDGTTDGNLVTTHSYSTAGSFTVTFTATDIQGHSSSISRIISINSLDPTVPVIGTQPIGKTVTEGTSVTFTVVATGNGVLTYQWKKDGTDLPGKTANTLTLGSVTTADAGTYSVVVTNTLNGSSQTSTSSDAILIVNAVVASDLNEGFETGTKGSYASATVVLGTGSWTLGDTLIAKSTTNGGSTSDHFNGLQGARMQNAAAGTASGKITMGFDWSYGAQTVSIAIAQYNTDAAAPGTLGLWYSTNGGTDWTQVAGTVTPSSTSIETYTWTVNVNQPIRFELRRTDTVSKGRICLDDIHIVGFP